MSDINMRDLDNYLTGHWGEDSVSDDEQEVAEMVTIARRLLEQTKTFELKGRLYPGAARQLAEIVLSYFGESE